MTAVAGRLYWPWTLWLSFLLLVLALRLSIAMLISLYGSISFGAPHPLEPVRYGLWVVEEDASPDREATAVRVASWRRILSKARADGIEWVRDSGLASLRQQGVALVLVPDARALSEDDAASLQRYVAAGGGALLVGSLGTTSAAGDWRGYKLMKQLLGVSEVVPLSLDASAGLEIGRPSALLSGRFAASERIALIREPGVAAVHNPNAELLWLRDETQSAEPAMRAASVRREVGKGRLVWIGAGPESGNGQGGLTLQMHDRLYLDSLRWLSRQPVIAVLPAAAGLEPGAAIAQHRVREAVRASVAVEGLHRLRVQVTNLAENPVEGVVLRLYFNRETGEATLAATTVLQSLPELERSDGGTWLDLAMPPLAADTSHSLYVDTPRTRWQ